MKKVIYKTIFTLILIISVLILFLAFVGINTNKFNSQIISQVKNFDKNLELELNDVSAKLNLFTLTIDAKTLGTNLTNKNNKIQLENIKTKISLKSLIKDKFAFTGISISTKAIPIRDLLGFTRSIKNDPKLFIVEQLVKEGFIVADIILKFDEFGKIKNNYKVNGFVDNGQISFLNKKLSKLNFNFQFSEKEYIFNDIQLLLNDKKILIPEVIALKKDNEFLVSGKLNSKNLYLKQKDIDGFIRNDFLISNIKELKFNSESNFTFKIDKKFKLKNLNITSSIDLDQLKLKNILKIKNFFPKSKDEILFNNQEIELKYNNNRLEITGSGEIFLQDKPDNIKYKLINDIKNFAFDVNLEILENPFIIDLLNYEKKKKSILNLIFIGKSNKDNLFFEKILLSEDQNTATIKNLKISNRGKINDIDSIKLDYLDLEKINNKIQIIKYNKNYKIFGESFNINKIITDLLDSNNEKKQDIFDKKFKLILDIKKIYLDKNNTTNNLKGTISYFNNEIDNLNLESEFSKINKIVFTIKTTDNGEKITTLFSNKAKPLIDRYKFIKGFNEGDLDFYSIKKNNKSISTLKIYDFKLKELPVLTKILTLASLQGIADLLSGEGIRFNEFEMNFVNENNLMTINEIYAIGPAISILMEGYIEKNNLISLRGTLVPATTINKTISSIPILGSILVGEKVGEGVFGVSFKIKGPPKKLVTSVNPIKTLTPRFITRTLEKIKKN